MLWVFAALACSLSDGAPTSAHLRGSGDDSATDVDGDGYDASVDCDDHEPRVHPGTEETCGNGRDDNCNGTADGCDWSGKLPLEGTKLTTTDDQSAIGTTLAVCDANGDGVGDVVVGAPGYNNDTGAVYVFYGPIRTDRDAKDADYALIGAEERLFTGFSVDCRRDVEGDGIADIVVGEPTKQGGGTAGTVYVVPGGGMGRAAIASEASSAWIGSDPNDTFGYELVAIAADDDETDELAVALGPTSDGPNRFGAVYVFDDAGPGVHDADGAAAYVYGEQGDRIDFVVGNAGDLDGDGLEELVVASKDQIVEEVLVFRAPFSGAIPKSDADVRIVGGPPGSVWWDGFGHADLDDDGRDDLFVANSLHENFNGAAYGFFAPIERDTNTASAEMRIVGTGDHYAAGSDVTSPGDIDGDGIADLVIGAAWGGVVYLQYGGGRGVYDLAKDAQASWQSKNLETLAGTAVAAGDVTGDGIGEFLIGAPGDGEVYEGSITIVPSSQL